jgi:hypothetical protein
MLSNQHLTNSLSLTTHGKRAVIALAFMLQDGADILTGVARHLSLHGERLELLVQEAKLATDSDTALTVLQFGYICTVAASRSLWHLGASATTINTCAPQLENAAAV